MAHRVSGLARIPDAFGLALRQLGDGRILGILLLALVITLVLIGPFLLIFVTIFGLLDLILPDSVDLPYFGQVGFLGVFTDGLVSRTTWVFWTYLMSPLVLAIVGALLDPIVDAVEARHYPALPRVRRRGFGEVIGYAIRFLLLMLGVSLGAGIVAWLTPIPATVVFVLATGYLIAREYFETVALRRMTEAEAKRLMRKELPVLWLSGCLTALALNVPFVSLVAPLVGVAAFTHLFHRTARGNRAAPLA